MFNWREIRYCEVTLENDDKILVSFFERLKGGEEPCREGGAIFLSWSGVDEAMQDWLSGLPGHRG